MIPIHKRRFCYISSMGGVAGSNLASVEKSHNDNVAETPPPIEKQA